MNIMEQRAYDNILSSMNEVANKNLSESVQYRFVAAYFRALKECANYSSPNYPYSFLFSEADRAYVAYNVKINISIELTDDEIKPLALAFARMSLNVIEHMLKAIPAYDIVLKTFCKRTYLELK
jgi:hypothetical protein